MTDRELEAAEQRAVKAMEFLAWRADWEQLPLPIPGPQYAPPDYGEMTGVLICKVCDREIRLHEVGEWHTR